MRARLESSRMSGAISVLVGFAVGESLKGLHPSPSERKKTNRDAELDQIRSSLGRGP